MMMRVIGVMLMVVVLSGCSSLSVVTDYSKEADFSKFKTFQYKESTMTFADTYPPAHNWVVNAIRGEMIAAGLTEVDSEPDVYVSYYGEKKKSTVNMAKTVDARKQYEDPDGFKEHRQQVTTREVTVREGTILINMWDTGNKELLWWAEITDTISKNPERNMPTIKNGFSEAFENFPPASKN